MGGYGSGHKSYPTKTTAEECLKLDANMLDRRKGIKPGVNRGTLRWTRGGWERGTCGYYAVLSGNCPWVDFLYNHRKVAVDLSWYAPGYGGYRYLFVCPRCGRRMRVLFFKGDEIACRLCHNLTYASCNESRSFSSMCRMAAGLNLSYPAFKKELRFMKMLAKMKPKRPRGRPRKSDNRHEY
jgi:hypothetical protein